MTAIVDTNVVAYYLLGTEPFVDDLTLPISRSERQEGRPGKIGVVVPEDVNA